MVLVVLSASLLLFTVKHKLGAISMGEKAFTKGETILTTCSFAGVFTVKHKLGSISIVGRAFTKG